MEGLKVEQVDEPEEGEICGEICVLEKPLESSIGSLVEEKCGDGKSSQPVQSKEEGEPLYNGAILEENGRLPKDREENGSEKEDEEENEDDEEDEEGMVEEDSDPFVESPAHESSDTTSDEEEDEEDVKDATGKFSKDPAADLQKLIRGNIEGSSDDEEISMEPPRTAHELKELPPVPKIDAVLEPHQIPQSVGNISSVFNKQVIVEATDHKLVLNEGSILWLTEQRIPLGIVDEVFGPVKKPYYVVRYNEAADIPEGATQGRDVAFVPELANFVQDDPELRKKGYDASGEHDEELSEADEFSDDEKEEEMRRAKRSNRVQGMGNSGRRGGRGGQEGGGGDRSTGRRGRGRGGHGRGRDFKTESPEMQGGAETAVQQMASMGLQRPNFQASPICHADRGPRYDQQPRQLIQRSPERQDSWNRNTHPESNYQREARPLMVPYSECQPLPYHLPQSPHHNFVPGMRSMQQQQQQQPIQGPPTPQWLSPVHHVQGPQVYQSYPAPYLASSGFQYPGHMYQTGVGLGPQTPYPHPPQIYAPMPSQSTGTGVFIPPISQYTRNSQCNQSQGLGHPDLQDRGGTAGNNIQVTGIAQHSSPAPAYLQQGVGPPLGGGAHSLSNIMYWSNNTSR
ncbi:unnamed protein product [Sphagnum jensenii]|uniref:H/ACA ribonucleoprotein complex non-core subunit NAF1 n=1 Tax=Sphagnum jensenii TaxID=128206 RepID=A0ABP1A197_9BRYO